MREQSAQMSQRLRAEGVPMHEFRATTQNFSPAIIELDPPCAPAACAMTAIRCSIGASAMSSARADRRGNLYRTKDQKIDAPVALMMAVGRAVVEDEEARGLDAEWLGQQLLGTAELVLARDEGYKLHAPHGAMQTANL
jgi:phage terminase large subunit-like protein